MWYEAYAEPRLREKTGDYYLNYIDKHIIPELGNIRLDKLTTIRVQKFYNDLQKSSRVQRYAHVELKDKGLSVRVIHGIHTLLNNCLEQAVAEWLILVNPAKGCKLPKTQNSVRVLPVSQQAVDLMVEEHKKHPGNPYMFPSPKTGGMFDPDSFRHTHDKILKTIGTEHIRFHDLRYTFATLSLKNGVDVKTLSSTLGHYSAGFTLSTYAHATPDMMRKAAEILWAM